VTISGWILPGGKFESLDGQCHENWLEANTDIHDNTGADVRQLALNRGYARARQYGGKLTIEVGAAFFRGAVRRAIGTLLETHAEDIDIVTIQLLNPAGAIIRSATERLFDAECPAAVALSVLESLI
jgi:hypothetical protein